MRSYESNYFKRRIKSAELKRRVQETVIDVLNDIKEGFSLITILM